MVWHLPLCEATTHVAEFLATAVSEGASCLLQFAWCSVCMCVQILPVMQILWQLQCLRAGPACRSGSSMQSGSSTR